MKVSNCWPEAEMKVHGPEYLFVQNSGPTDALGQQRPH
jgi:hypothetical protein